MKSAIYIPREKKWAFSHQHDRSLGVRLYSVTNAEIVRWPRLETGNLADSTRGHRKKWWSRCLAQDVPEMGPAIPWIENYLEESQVVAASAVVSDPTVGRLLGFGTAWKLNNHKDRLVEVAGFPSGPIGSDLVISEVRRQRLEFTGSSGVSLLVPRITSPGAQPLEKFDSPIRQIQFASSSARGNLPNSRVAVRLAASTQIYKVTTEGRVNQLGLQSVATVRPEASNGKSEHVDVSFNPFYERQFGTIDRDGNWQVWDVEGSYHAYRKGLGLTLRNTTKGRTTTDSDPRFNWGRVVWGGDIHTLVACDRRKAALFDIRASSDRMSAIQFPTGRERNWLLDLQRAPAVMGPHEAFLLSSSHIICIDTRFPGYPLLQIAHNRHRDDVSMYMNIFNKDQVANVCVESRMNQVNSVVQFLSSTTGVPSFLNDPYIITPSVGPPSYPLGPMSTAMLPCGFEYAASASGPALNLEKEGAVFFIRYSIDRQLGIVQNLYSNRNQEHSFIKTRKVVYEGRVTKSSTLVVEDESDEYVQREAPEQKITRPVRLYKSDQIRFESEFPTHERINFNDIYKLAYIHDLDALFTVHASDTQNSAIGFTSGISELLTRRADRADRGVYSLLEIRSPSMLFDDLTQFQNLTQDMLDSSTITNCYNVKELLSGSGPGLQTGNCPAPVGSVYDKLLAANVSNLPAEVPGRTRLRRERLARFIATELFLAGKGLNIKPTKESLHPPRPLDTPPEVTPNLEPESELLGCIKEYAHVQPHISLNPGLGTVLDSWKVGEDPWEFEYFVDPEEGVPRYRKDRRKLRKEKRLQAEPNSSQPPTLMERPVVSSQISSAQDASQPTVVSQVERGRFSGKMQSGKRKTGF